MNSLSGRAEREVWFALSEKQWSFQHSAFHCVFAGDARCESSKWGCRAMVTGREGKPRRAWSLSDDRGDRNNAPHPCLGLARAVPSLQTTAAWKHVFFFFPFKKFSGSLGEGRCCFFFVIMGPFVEMEEEKRSVCRRGAGSPLPAKVPRQGS